MLTDERESWTRWKNNAGVGKQKGKKQWAPISIYLGLPGSLLLFLLRLFLLPSLVFDICIFILSSLSSLSFSLFFFLLVIIEITL